MRIGLFYHSLVSDWNHGNAHFLRGIAAELIGRGCEVEVFEPEDGWSRQNLVVQEGPEAIRSFHRAFPGLTSTIYRLDNLPLERVERLDLVIVHEWNEPEVVAALGRLRRSSGFRLLFHDTHHRAVTRPEEMSRFDLSGYDGALVFGAALARVYEQKAWLSPVWVWHEAADHRLFRPLANTDLAGDLVWVGNWGDGERSADLSRLLIEPAAEVGLTGNIYGVRYPPEAVARLRRAGLSYRGWTANHEVPQLFSSHRLTVHIPRRPYLKELSGVPTIRLFEALACGIPLIVARWCDEEGMFDGDEYLRVQTATEMRVLMRRLLYDAELVERLCSRGPETIAARHTSRHRVDELFAIVEQMGVEAPEAAMI